jgi:hypothetical protein
MKPQLPPEIESLIPDDVLGVIYKFVPHLPKPKKLSWGDEYGFSPSPSLARELRSIQSAVLKGKNEMYLRELEDFVLDRR